MHSFRNYRSDSLLALSVRLGSVRASLDDEVGGLLLLAGEVALDDVLGASGVALLGVDGGSRV